MPPAAADTPSMKTVRSVIIVAALLAAASHAEAQFAAGPSTTPAENYRVELSLIYWNPTPELAITDGGLSAVGGAIDFVNEFGIENSHFREFRATLTPVRKHKLRLSYVPIRYEASAFLVRTISFEGRTFAVGADASTKIKWDLWRFGYEYDIVSGSRGFVGVIGEVRYNQIDARITSTAGSAETTTNVPVPTVGGIARGYLGPRLLLTAEFSGLSIDREDFRGSSYDLDVYGNLNLGSNIGVQIGYRSVSAEYLVDADTGELKLKGIYFGGTIRF
jgi:hypothetical protein